MKLGGLRSPLTKGRERVFDGTLKKLGACRYEHARRDRAHLVYRSGTYCVDLGLGEGATCRPVISLTRGLAK